MKLAVSTPLAIVVEAGDVAHVRGEDATGAFGILPGHADFLTVLATSVVTWRDPRGSEHYVAVRGGVLEVRDGNAVAIATREAVVGDDLHMLESKVLVEFERRLAEEQTARADAQRLYSAAIRQIIRYLRPDGSPELGESIGETRGPFSP